MEYSRTKVKIADGPDRSEVLQRLRGMTGAAGNEATLEDVSTRSGPRANACVRSRGWMPEPVMTISSNAPIAVWMRG